MRFKQVGAVSGLGFYIAFREKLSENIKEFVNNKATEEFYNKSDMEYRYASDRRTFKALKSGDNDTIHITIQVLEKSIDLFDVANPSKAIIHFNLARLKNAIGDSSLTQKNINETIKFSKSIIMKRLKINPSLLEYLKNGFQSDQADRAS